MRSVTNRMLVSLVGVALAAPFFAIAVIVGARVVALAQNAQDELLLVGLAFGGAWSTASVAAQVRRSRQAAAVAFRRMRNRMGLPRSTSAIEFRKVSRHARLRGKRHAAVCGITLNP
jgi:hypothetical protein